jgi:hypothetical protein
MDVQELAVARTPDLELVGAGAVLEVVPGGDHGESRARVAEARLDGMGRNLRPAGEEPGADGDGFSSWQPGSS